MFFSWKGTVPEWRPWAKEEVDIHFLIVDFFILHFMLCKVLYVTSGSVTPKLEAVKICNASVLLQQLRREKKYKGFTNKWARMEKRRRDKVEQKRREEEEEKRLREEK